MNKEDAAKLKEAITAEVEREQKGISADGVFAIIDSLTKESEAEPVETNAIVAALRMCESEIRDYNDRALPHNINEALDVAYSQIKQLEALKPG